MELYILLIPSSVQTHPDSPADFVHTGPGSSCLSHGLCCRFRLSSGLSFVSAGSHQRPAEENVLENRKCELYSQCSTQTQKSLLDNLMILQVYFLAISCLNIFQLMAFTVTNGSKLGVSQFSKSTILFVFRFKHLFCTYHCLTIIRICKDQQILCFRP